MPWRPPLAARIIDIPVSSLRATLRNFKGVEHRLEFVRELNGVTYVNDSKGTNVDSVWYALQSLPHPIIVMLGGRDKGNDYSRLVELVKKHVKAIVAIGESADRVVSAFAGIVPVQQAGSMKEAVQYASELGRQRRRGASLPGVRIVRLVRQLRAPRTRLQGTRHGAGTLNHP